VSCSRPNLGIAARISRLFAPPSTPQLWSAKGIDRQVAHFFNHQTHRRGRSDAMLTTGGQRTGDTDLFLIV